MSSGRYLKRSAVLINTISIQTVERSVLSATIISESNRFNPSTTILSTM